MVMGHERGREGERERVRERKRDNEKKKSNHKRMISQKNNNFFILKDTYIFILIIKI